MRPHPLPSLGYLREMQSLLRVHPNGFIQLDLDEANRLHVWHPNLPFRQKTFHPVHDHIFSLQSSVHSGRLIHVEYEPYAEGDAIQFGTHQRWQVSHLQTNEETILKPTDEPPCYLAVSSAHVIQPGNGYTFPAYKFHETLSNVPTMTVMTKVMDKPMRTGTDCAGASVMVPVGVEPDNDFNREVFNPRELWRLIEEAYPS